MAIVFFNNWKTAQEFIFIDISFRENHMISLAFFGLGIVMAF